MKFINSRGGSKQTITEEELLNSVAEYIEDDDFIRDRDFWVNMHYGDELYFTMSDGFKDEAS